jgi:D-glycero-beta-D-manno-heptose 1-phosphate adenylyltransferase
MAAAVSLRHKRLRASEAVPPKQRQYDQRCLDQTEDYPHRNLIFAPGDEFCNRIFRSSCLFWFDCYTKCVARLYLRGELLEQRKQWKQEGKTVVFTNGCYDLLHPGHIRLLERARSLGDVLILALNSDASVRRAKGPNRPLLSEGERTEVALALEAVDAITLFDEDTPRELIADVLPDVLVKGADWSHFIAGREEVEASGGRVLTIALEPGYSTTNIVDSILKTP